MRTRRLHFRYVLPVLCGMYLLNFMDRTALGTLSQAIQQDLGFSDSMMGVMHSALLVSLIFMILPVSILNDLTGRRRILSLCMGLWSLAMLATGMAASFMSFVAARVCGSFNDASSGSGCTSWLAQSYPEEKRGQIMGIFTLCSPLGMALGGGLAGIILELTGSWRNIFYLLALGGLILFPIIYHLPDKQRPLDMRMYLQGLRHVFLSRTLICTGIAMGCFNIMAFSYQTWLPSLLMRTYDMNNGPAGSCFAAMLIMAAAGNLLAGRFGDWWNRRSPSGRIYAAISCILLASFSKILFYYVLPYLPIPWGISLGLLDGLSTMALSPITHSIVQDVSADTYRNAASGTMGVLSFLFGGAIGPMLAGLLSDSCGGGANGIRMGLLTLSFCGFISAGLFFLIRRHFPREKAFLAIQHQNCLTLPKEHDNIS